MSNVVPLPEFQSSRKQLDVSDELLAQAQYVADTDLKADDIVVFEATVMSTMPITKPGSLFHGAKASRSLFSAMAESVNTKAQSVPLHTLHQQSFELPIGRVFHANVEDRADGQSELRARFYLAKSEAQMIEKINLGILDETSVGVTSEQMLCSKCGFDYRGEDAGFENFFDQTCNNGHTIGEDGTHLVLQGLDRWMELSLVSRGASHKAKIHGRARSLMPKEQQDRLAASGENPEAVTLFTSATATPGKETPMSTKPDDTPPANPNEPAAKPAEFDAKAAHDELKTSIDALVTKLSEEPAAPAEPAVTPDPEIETLKASVEALTTKIEDLTKSADLRAGLPAGGVATDSAAGSTPTTPKREYSAFKVPK